MPERISNSSFRSGERRHTTAIPMKHPTIVKILLVTTAWLMIAGLQTTGDTSKNLLHLALLSNAFALLSSIIPQRRTPRHLFD